MKIETISVENINDENASQDFSGGSCGNLATGVIEGTKIYCGGVKASQIEAGYLGGKDMKITAGIIDARHLKS